LRGKGYEDDDIEETMQWLISKKYIDDVNYGYEYLRYAFEKGRGIGRIKYELKEKGLSSEDIQAAIFVYEDENDADIMEEEYERALGQAKRAARVNGTDEKGMAKTGRRLNSLGYSNSVIFKVLDAIRGEER
jgi:SOS response regulatory protein OraA/RecX